MVEVIVLHMSASSLREHSPWGRRQHPPVLDPGKETVTGGS